MPSITRSGSPISSATRPPALRSAARPSRCALSGASSTAVTATDRRRRKAPAHSASPPLLPAPTSSVTCRPAVPPVWSRSIASAWVATPYAALRMSAPSGVRASSRSSAALTWSVVQIPSTGYSTVTDLARLRGLSTS
jgi:hypothetical protein